MDNNKIMSQDFLNLIKDGEFDGTVKEYLQSSSCFHTAINSLGSTLLHYAVQQNNANLTQYLLDNDFPIDIQDLRGNTPLMIAVSENHKTLIPMLLNAGADMFKLNKEGESAIQILSTQHVIEYDVVNLFFDTLQNYRFTDEQIVRKLKDNRCPIYLATLMGDPTIILQMINNFRCVRYSHPTNQITAMHMAALIDNFRITKILLRWHADPDARNALNENPFSFVYKENRDHNCRKILILKVLLQSGATMTSCTSDGYFQVKHTLIKGNCKSIHVLLRSDLDFEARDSYGYETVLHYLAKNINPGVGEKLKLYDKKFEINVVNKHNETPLCVAVKEGNVKMVKFFLKQGARTDVEYSTNNPTPLHYAYECAKSGFEKQYQQCGEMLLQSHANPQLTFTKENGEVVTIFDAALQMNDYDRVKPIVAHLVMMEKLGTPIMEFILAKINSHEPLKNYFNECRELLTEQISAEISDELSEQVDLLDLLTSDKKKMARYLNYETIVRKLWKRSDYKRRLTHFSYYYNVLESRRVEGKRYKTLIDRAAKVICKIFQNRLHKTHLIIDMVINNLDEESLRQMIIAAKSI